MKKKLIVTAIVLLITVSIISFVAAEISLAATVASQPQGANSSDRNRHIVMDHEEHHGDRHHVGTDTDRNGGGFIRGKHVGRDRNIYVHTDKEIPN